MTAAVSRVNMRDAGLSTTHPKIEDDIDQPHRRLNFSSWFKMCYPHDSFDDLQNPVFWRDAVVETVVCMYIECCVIWAFVTLHKEMYSPNITHLGLFSGFFIYALIEGYGPISGAPLNPAGCWGFFLAGRMSAARMVVYSLGEIGGAAAGAMVGYSLQPANNVTVLHTLQPGAGLLPAQGMVIEAILTFNLLFVALSVTNPRGKIAIMPSLPIAFCIGTGIMAAGTHTGGLQNPIIAWGPAIINGNFEHHWVYWVGPYIGATVGSLSYQLSSFVKDHFEQPQIQDDDVKGHGNQAHTD